MVFRTFYPSPLGSIILESDGTALTGLRFSDDAPVDTVNDDPLPVFRQTKAWLDRYFARGKPDQMLKLHLIGTPFQTAIWELLRKIPYGQTVTYGQLAQQYAELRGLPRCSAQAIGGALARNPILLLVPCHRVIGANGSLTGFAAGLERKKCLLALEGVL